MSEEQKKEEDVCITTAKGWFCEINQQWPDQALMLRVDELKEDHQSKYQHVQVFSNKTWGNVLVLDGCIQYTEKDQCAYQEMMAHTPMCAHKNPRACLVVGGGDGGIIRELLKHPSVERIVICEIDQMVIDMGKKYFKDIAETWADPRVELVCGDANVYIGECKAEFDVLVSDTSDPDGPARPLFELPFYKKCRDALRPGGILVTQAEEIWLNLSLIHTLRSNALSVFDDVTYGHFSIPTYPCGVIGYLCCAVNPEDLPEGEAYGAKIIQRRPQDIEGLDSKLQYYTSELHVASFVLPKFARDAIYRD